MSQLESALGRMIGQSANRAALRSLMGFHYLERVPAMKTMAKITAVAVFLCSLSIGASAPVRAQTLAPLFTPGAQFRGVQLFPQDPNKASSYDDQLFLDSRGDCPLIFSGHNIDKYKLIFHQSDKSLLIDQTAPLHLSDKACVEKATRTLPLVGDFGEGIEVSVSEPKKFEELFAISSKANVGERLARSVAGMKPLDEKCEKSSKVCVSLKSDEKKVSVEFSIKCKNMPEVTVSTDGASIKVGHFSVSYSID
jgi:hypothetical protein